MSVETKDIRNFALISHGGAGKTTLTEMSLFNAGQIEQPGKVENGDTNSDFTPEEAEHQYSINNSYFSFPWNEKEINLIDTPGYADFRGEISSALKIVEGATLLIDATAGIEVNTNYVWSKAVENNLFRFIFINKVDKEDSNFAEVYKELQSNFEDNLFPLTIPYRKNGKYQGIIDLISKKLILFEDGEEKKVNIPDEAEDFFKEYRLEFIETIVELDDELMIKYLEDEEIKDEELLTALVKGIKDKEVVPVMSGSALKNSGLKNMLDYMTELLPSPEDLTNLQLNKGNIEDIDTSNNKPVLALVGKTMVDPYIGKLSIFRVYGGSLTQGKEIYVPRIDTKLKMSKLYKINGADQDKVDQLVAGQIGAVAKMDDLETSDTISAPEFDVELEKIQFPEPMLIQTAQPAADVDEEKMSTALHRYSKEDPTFKVRYNKETKQLLVTGMGSVHISVIKDICKRKFEADFLTEEPKVEYKEAIRKKIKVEEKYKKQSGGRGQYGHVLLRIEPLKRGKGFEFDEEIFGGAIPSQYIPAVEKGIREAKTEGILAGYPVVDFKATVYDGSYHDVDSSEMAFKIAASKAFRKGVKQAKPVILEPIMKISVRVPEKFMGDIMGDLNSRRGKIMGMEPEGDHQIINAEVPQSELFTYSIELKSITGGYGSFTMEFSHYDKVPGEIEEEIIEKAEQEKK